MILEGILVDPAMFEIDFGKLISEVISRIPVVNVQNAQAGRGRGTVRRPPS
jgi:hypothetical protein